MSRTIESFSGRIGTGLFCALVVMAGCGGDSPGGQSGSRGLSGEGSMPGVQVLPRTDLAATLDAAIGDRNLIWCSTLVSAWKDLEEFNGSPVQLDPPSQLAEALNRVDFRQDALPAGSAVHGAGLIGDGIIESLQGKLGRLPGQHSTPLLDEMRQLPPDAVVAYGYLKTSLPFAAHFDVLDPKAFTDSSKKVKWFGLEDYSPQMQREQGRQVRILWHRFPSDDTGKQQFAVELLTTAPDSRLILAAVKPRPTLRETVGHVLELARQPNTLRRNSRIGLELDRELARLVTTAEGFEYHLQGASQYADLQDGEDLKVPFLHADVQGEFFEAPSHRFISENAKLSGKPFSRLCQSIKFHLDHTGASVESEATGIMFGDSYEREFVFNGPFLVLLCEKESLQPYFALWVANDELLVGPDEDSD